MVNKCCVPRCDGNYAKGEKVHVFKFPHDEKLRGKWLKAICRKDFKVSKHSVVCHKHFQDKDIKWTDSQIDWKSGQTITVDLKVPRLNVDAVPSLMPNCPSYLSSSETSRPRTAPVERKSRNEARAIEKAIFNSTKTAAEQHEKFHFSTLEELKQKLRYITLYEDWSIIEKANCIIICYLNNNVTPHVIYYIIIQEDLRVEVFNGNSIPIKIGKIPDLVNSILQIDDMILTSQKHLKGEESNEAVIGTIFELLDKLKIDDTKLKCIDFIKNQIELCVQSKFHHKFQADTMVVFSMIALISPHAYKFLRKFGILILPHPNTLKNLCSNVNIDPKSSQYLSYIKDKRKLLKPHESSVTLMLDEIHLKAYLDYKAGNLVGSAYDSLDLATTAHVFMVQSLLSNFKDVVHMLPVNKMKAEQLFVIIEKVIVGLEDSGFHVIAIVTDNNKINSKAISNFSNVANSSDAPTNTKKSSNKSARNIVYPHPSNKSKPLFYLNDSVHIFKCIRNNWLNLKNEKKTFCYPDFDDYKTVRFASFEALRQVYNIETENLLKFSHNLSLKALWPSTFERQNVKLVTQIFNENVEISLVELGPTNKIANYADTAQFINIIKNWWYIVNVKTPYKGIRLRSELQKPLTNQEGDERRAFLEKMFSWLNAWKSLPYEGKLTSETHEALAFSVDAILEISDYCITELNMSYILPGKFQTDALEDRFGQYRQLCGAQYHVTLRQIFEAEKKLRMLSLLDLSIKEDSKEKTIISNFDHCDEPSKESLILNKNLAQQFNISDYDLNLLEADIPVLTYISGYCCYATIKKTKCEECKEFLTIDREMVCDINNRLIIKKDRGALRFPRDSVVTVTMHNYAIVKQLLQNELFIKHSNNRNIACCIIWELISDADIMPESNCMKHEVWKKIIYVTVNILINNYCKIINNKQNEKPKKNRKLQTVKKNSEIVT